MSHSLFPTYARTDIVFDYGKGTWLWDKQGKRYLDCLGGIAVNILGHAHPHLTAALKNQADKLWHVSNLYHIAEQEKLGQCLCAASFADRVFFTNSGAEAVEMAIKTARRFNYVNGQTQRSRIICFEGAFHGRTLGTIAAGGNPAYLEGFGEPLAGFDHVPLHDETAIKNALGDETAAILIEPIQGEAGIKPVKGDFLRFLREQCDAHGIILMFDEIQCGMGRSGKLFAHEWAECTPDIMAIAKGIGGGFPLGGVLATENVADAMTPGTHGTTFGGNPLAMAVGGAVMDIVLEDSFLSEVVRKSSLMHEKLSALVDSYDDIFELIRGKGLMIGIKCKRPIAEVLTAAREQGLIIGPAGDNVVRFLPALNITDTEIDHAVHCLEMAAQKLRNESL